ncbi:hypothetical protein Y032_0148g2644 [Ancylostoma ceylanicum]|uniref:Uncharacterized protein n=1 Tax=Ancylostoma ceylanicum TaxID=53326 RepID=A0A016T112_9BILA|nr:hypothetical protein Y032_0148g2644 [Ancylostoma ceylanicum]
MRSPPLQCFVLVNSSPHELSLAFATFRAQCFSLFPSCFAMAARNRNISLQADFMGTVGKILVDEHYPTEIDDAPLFDKIESIRSNVKFEQCYERSKLIGD